MTSPIDILIDRAIASGQMKTMPMVTLRCPCCERKKRVRKDPTDLKRTAYVEVQCDKCHQGDKVEVRYYDALNRHLNPATGKPFTHKRSTP